MLRQRECTWMHDGQAVLIRQGPKTGAAAENYCPIICLPAWFMWKLFTGIILEKHHKFLKQREYPLPPDEQKGCRKRSKWTNEMKQMEEEESCYEEDWLQEGFWYDSTSIDYLAISGATENIKTLLTSSMRGWQTQMEQVWGRSPFIEAFFKGTSSNHCSSW